MIATEKVEGERRKKLDPATKVVAPVVVIGSLIVGLLIAVMVYRRRSQSEYPHRPFFGFRLK